jgi:hypothetical protein
MLLVKLGASNIDDHVPIFKLLIASSSACTVDNTTLLQPLLKMAYLLREGNVTVVQCDGDKLRAVYGISEFLARPTIVCL